MNEPQKPYVIDQELYGDLPSMAHVEAIAEYCNEHGYPTVTRACYEPDTRGEYDPDGLPDDVFAAALAYAERTVPWYSVQVGDDYDNSLGAWDEAEARAIAEELAEDECCEGREIRLCTITRDYCVDVEIVREGTR